MRAPDASVSGSDSAMGSSEARRVTFGAPTADDVGAVRALLEAAELPHDDLGASAFADWFAVARLSGVAVDPADRASEASDHPSGASAGSAGSTGSSRPFGERGRIVGAVAVEPCGDDGLLRSLVVDPAHRTAGLGSALVRAAEARARDDGRRALYLLTTTATGFFAARGYRVIERESAPEDVRATTEFRAMCPDTAICMWKPLGS